MLERTLVIIKPDAVDRTWQNVPAQIQIRYKKAGLKSVVGVQFVMQYEQAAEFYKEHEEKIFYSGLKLAMSSGPSIVMILEGEGAIEIVRKLHGATNPAEAKPGTIRHDFKSAGGPFNMVHGSANEKDFKREYALFVKWDILPR